MGLFACAFLVKSQPRRGGIAPQIHHSETSTIELIVIGSRLELGFNMEKEIQPPHLFEDRLPPLLPSTLGEVRAIGLPER